MGAEDDSVNLITPRAFSAAVANNVFDNAFNDGMDIEEWDDWMKWERNSTDLIVPTIPGRQSTTNSISSLDSWALDQETVDMEPISNSRSNDSDFPSATYHTISSKYKTQSQLGVVPHSCFKLSFIPTSARHAKVDQRILFSDRS
jgi:hypothetical protein